MLLRCIFFALAWVSLGLGAIGIFVPLLPTTPFLILSAFCFSRSSDRWYRWLLSRPHIGPLISDWQERGVIRPPAKWMAGIMLCVSVIFVWLVTPLMSIKILTSLLLLSILIFISTRPSR